MSTTIEYSNKESASEFTPLVVLENGRDSFRKIVPDLSLHMDHEDSSPLLNRDSDNSSPDSDLDPLVSDVHSLSNGLVKPSVTNINHSFSGGNTPLLSRDDSSSAESDASSSTLESEAGPQVDYMPLGELDGTLSDKVFSNENSQDDSSNLTGEASGNLSYSQLEAEKSAAMHESCICATTEAEPLQLDLKSSLGGSQDDKIESQEQLPGAKPHAESSSVGSSSLMESQDPSSSGDTLKDSGSTITEPSSTSNGQNTTESETSEKLDVETPDGVVTVTDVNRSDTILLQQSNQDVLEQQLSNNRLSTVLESNETHANNGSVEEEGNQATVPSDAQVSTLEQCDEQNSEHMKESADPAAVQEDRADIQLSSERQASGEDVVSSPSMHGDSQGSSNLDRSTREESNLDTGVRSDLPVLQPLSPKHGLDQQYEYLRRTLSHSRRRYSTRRRRQNGSRGDDPGNSVSHGRLRYTESLNHHGSRGADPVPSQKHARLRHTESLIHYGTRQQQTRQDILSSTEPAQRGEDPGMLMYEL